MLRKIKTPTNNPIAVSSLTRKQSIVSPNLVYLDEIFIEKFDIFYKKYTAQHNIDKEKNLNAQKILLDIYYNKLVRDGSNPIHIIFSQIILLRPKLHDELTLLQYTYLGYTFVTNQIASMLENLSDKTRFASFVKNYANNRLSKLEQMFIFLKCANHYDSSQYLNVINMHINYKLGQDCSNQILPLFNIPMELVMFSQALLGLIRVEPHVMLTLMPILKQSCEQLKSRILDGRIIFDTYQQALKALKSAQLIQATNDQNKIKSNWQLPLYGKFCQSHNKKLLAVSGLVMLGACYLSYKV